MPLLDTQTSGSETALLAASAWPEKRWLTQEDSKSQPSLGNLGFGRDPISR